MFRNAMVTTFITVLLCLGGAATAISGPWELAKKYGFTKSQEAFAAFCRNSDTQEK